MLTYRDYPRHLPITDLCLARLILWSGCSSGY